MFNQIRANQYTADYLCSLEGQLDRDNVSIGIEMQDYLCPLADIEHLNKKYLPGDVICIQGVFVCF